MVTQFTCESKNKNKLLNNKITIFSFGIIKDFKLINKHT